MKGRESPFLLSNMTSFHSGRSHFELFGLPARFDVDLRELERSYREIQSRIHPDRFASAPDSERRASMQWTTHVNEAYQTLKSPLRRARYLLELAGVDALIESNTAMPAEFLAEQIEWREAVEEASATRDARELESLARRLQVELANLYASMARVIEEHDHAAAAAALRKLMFLEKLQAEIGSAMETIEE